MNRHFIPKRDDSQVAGFELGNLGPKAVAIVVLRLGPDWGVEHARAPLLLEVRPLTHHLFLEIFREPVVGHLLRDNAGRPRRFTARHRTTTNPTSKREVWLCVVCFVMGYG